jgi:hypothetical protein
MTTTVQPAIETANPTNVRPFPAIKPGHRLAPLALGVPGAGQQIVFVECPDWCTEDHVQNFVHFMEDVDHKGDEFAIAIPSFWNEQQAAYRLTAALASDPMAEDSRMRDAHVIVGDSGSVDAYLAPHKADAVADDLIQLAAKIREAARTARLHNQHEASKAVTA